MTLIPPFEMEKSLALDFMSEATEILDSHTIDHSDWDNMRFTQMKTLRSRPTLLGLVPEMPMSILYCQEELFEVAGQYGAQFLKKKKQKEIEKNILLPIGRFFDPIELEIGLDTAVGEIQLPLSLDIQDVLVFEKVPGQWIPQRALYKKAEEVNQRQNRFNMEIA